MQSKTDSELVALYAAGGAQAEQAFAEIVRRHGGVVYAACRRLLGDAAAEDAVQAVFMLLARKAGSLSRGEALAGWLYGAASLVAREHLRSARRRERAEKERAIMREAGKAGAAGPSWSDLRPEIDAALGALPRQYRDAVVLSCLEGKPEAEVARELGVPAGTVKSRLARGLERLRERLGTRGVVVPAAALAGLLGAHGVEALPAALAAKLAGLGAAGALSTGIVGAVGAVGAQHAAPLPSIMMEGAMKAMFWMKVKLAAAVLVGAAAVGGGGAAAILAAAEPSGSGKPPAEKPAVQQPAPPEAGKTVLSELAASMKPGSWAKLETKGLTRELTHVTPRELSIFGWSDDGAWDPVSGQFLFMGFRLELKFVAYSEKTNEWRQVPTFKWPLKSSMGHPYGNNAVDPAKSIFFHHVSSSPLIYAFDTREEKWSELPPCPFKSSTYGWAIEFFPDMNAMLFVHERSAYKLDMDKKEWSVLTAKLPTGAGPHKMVRYNARHHCMLIAGGDGGSGKEVVRIDADGKLTAMKDAPVALSLNNTKVLAEPTTGDFLVLKADSFHAYDIEKDQWTKIEDPDMQPPSRDGSLVVAPIEKYGVSMWVEGRRYQAGRCWLFKYRRPEAAGKPEAR